MYVVEGEVEMQVFEALERNADELTLQLCKTHHLGPDEQACLPAGESCFHTVVAKTDCLIIDAFSVCDDVNCISVFYEPDTTDLVSGPFKATKISNEEAKLPQYFREDYASNCS